MTHLYDKAQAEVKRAYTAYCEETKKAGDFYDETINTISCNSSENEGIKEESIVNYNHMNLIMSWVEFERYVKNVATSLFLCKGEEILNPDVTAKKNKHIWNSTKDKCKLIHGKQMTFSFLYEQSQRLLVSTLLGNEFSRKSFRRRGRVMMMLAHILVLSDCSFLII